MRAGETAADIVSRVADLAGVPLENHPLSPTEWAAWRAEREAFERDLPNSRLWRRTMLILADAELSRLKELLFHPDGPAADPDDVHGIESYAARLRAAPDALVVDMYRICFANQPLLAAGCVCVGRDMQARDILALLRYYDEMDGRANA
jgi:hypothetical protein